MHHALHLGGGAGGDLDQITAAAGDIRKGLISVNADGDAITGTLAEQTTINSTVNCGSSVTIPAGIYNSAGKVTGATLASQTSATATATDITKGKTAWVGGTKITGTVTVNSTISSSINCGASVTIPAGIYSSAGKVTANSLSSQTSATASAAYISKGYTAWVNGTKVTGTLATQGGSTTTPGTSNKTIVSAAKHVTGNIIVAGSSNLVASNIKKGVNIFGVTGTFEGYVAGTNYVFNQGAWGSGYSLGSFTSIYSDVVSLYSSGNVIVVPTTGYAHYTWYLNNQFNFGAYKSCVLVYTNNSHTSGTTTDVGIVLAAASSPTSSNSSSNYMAYTNSFEASATLVLDLSSVNASGYIHISVGNSSKRSFQITQMYLTS